MPGRQYPKIKAKHGGGDGIRTREGFNTLHDFQSCAFDHSATPPLIKRNFNKPTWIIVTGCFYLALMEKARRYFCCHAR